MIFKFCSELTGYQWLQKPELEKQLVEILVDKEYESFISAMERLRSLPYAYRIKDFIMKYTTPLMKKITASEVPKLQYDEQGRSYITVYGEFFVCSGFIFITIVPLECLRKRARGHVTVRAPGTGIVTINGQDITYFDVLQSREQVKSLTHHAN